MRSRAVLPTLLVIMATAALVAGCTPSQLTSPPDTDTASSVSSSKTPRFIVVCRFDHRAANDPIVFPGSPGVSHSHDFAGNTSTDASSTAASLRSNTVPAAFAPVYPGTSCGRPGDRSAYWAPTLMRGYLAYPAKLVRIYYRSALNDPRSVQPFPPGLKMIAGNARATSPQDLDITSWACGSGGDQTEVGHVPTCPPNASLHLKVVFPNCWNGRDLDSVDHKSHMAYSSSGRCPTGFPVAVPKLSMILRYTGVSGPGTHLACGNDVCGHADFFDGWDPTAAAALVRGCMWASIDCRETGGPGGGVIPNGSGIPDSAPAPPMSM